MILLFEKRLGWDFFRPLGMEWYHKGYHLLGGGDPTAIAYLELNPTYFMGEDGYWRWPAPLTEAVHRCMTWQQFVDEQVDVIVCTHPAHERCFHELRDKYHPKAKVIRVMGNVSEIKQGISQNIMDSVGLYGGPENYVHFHQEFPLDHFWYAEPPKGVISQYLNFFHKHPMRIHWEQYKPLLPEFTWKEHGHEGPDGFLWPLSKVAEAMRNSSFVWHIKQEGYGHMIHGAFAASRPVITHMADYKGKTAGAMMEDEVTCVDLNGSPRENVAKIRRCHERLTEMCENVRDRFKQVVDFDAEEIAIREFVGRLR